MSGCAVPRRCQVAALLAAWAISALTPAVWAEDPRWMRLQLPEASVGMEVESATEETRVSSGTSTYEHLSLTPLVGLRAQGSIYHPNLLTFDLNGELGWGWDTITSKSPGSSQTRDDSQELRRYLVQVNILSAKPYNATFFTSEDHTFRDYGTLNTFTVDSTRYGGRMSWNAESFSLTADMGTRDEKSDGLTSSSELSETYFNFTGIHRRSSGQTMLTYRFNEFDNILTLGNSRGSVNNTVGISDSETFGGRKQITATTGTSFSQSEYGNQQTETVTANENITIHHRPRLESYFALDFGDSRLSSAAASRLQGSYGVRHQLYESLVSHFDVHGSRDENSSGANVASSDRYGVGLFEDYTKRLGKWGRLSMGAGIIADHEDYDSTGGNRVTIDEPHVLYLTTSTNYHPVYLNQPRVILATVQVRGPGGVPVVETTDYQLYQIGDLTEIRLVQTSAVLHDGDAVTVTYQSDSLNNASFESLNATAQIRLDLFGKFGIYGRFNSLGNNAPPGVLTQSLTDLVGGVDVTWRWFRAGAEYEDYDSNFSRYQAWRFFQTGDFHPDDSSTLSVSLVQTFYSYGDDRRQTQYQFLGRYNIQFLFSLAWYVEAGYALQDVLGTDESLISARTGLTWTRGKLSLRTGYEYNSQTTSAGLWTEERERNRFYAYLKRTF